MLDLVLGLFVGIIGGCCAGIYIGYHHSDKTYNINIVSKNEEV